MKNKEGEIIGHLGAGHDITHKKVASKALLESEEKFHKILQSTPLPLCYVDKNGSFEYINDRFIKVLGYDKNDVPDIDTWWVKAYPDEKYREWVKNNWNGKSACTKPC